MNKYDKRFQAAIYKHFPQIIYCGCRVFIPSTKWKAKQDQLLQSLLEPPRALSRVPVPDWRGRSRAMVGFLLWRVPWLLFWVSFIFLVFGFWRVGWARLSILWSIQASNMISTASSQGWSHLISWTSGYRASLGLDRAIPVVTVSQPIQEIQVPPEEEKNRRREFPTQWLVTPDRVIMLSQVLFILKVELVPTSFLKFS